MAAALHSVRLVVMLRWDADGSFREHHFAGVLKSVE